MNSLLNNILSIAEGLYYGPLYALQKRATRSPSVLDEELVWKESNRKRNVIVKWFLKNYPPSFLRGFILSSKMNKDHRIGISKHYNVSNDFYKLFLDQKYMFYSAGDFHSDEESLEQAQGNKADFLLEMIDPQPGEKILDLGFGWGSMLRRIYEHTGDSENLFGYTISE